MTLLGKIFTVLIMIMSVMFMSFSIVVYATHTNWKEKSVELVKEVSVRQGVVDSVKADLDVQKERLEREQAARRFALASLQIRADEYSSRQQVAEGLLRDQQAENDKLTQSLVDAEDNMQKLTTEVTQLRVDIRDAQMAADEFFAQVLVLTDGNVQLEGEQIRFLEKNSQLIAQISRLTNVLTNNGLDENSDVTQVTPDVDGIVTAVAQETLQISLGFDDGLREGHQFDVYRGATFLGRIKILRIKPSTSVGEIIPEFRRGAIRKGDRVAKEVG